MEINFENYVNEMTKKAIEAFENSIMIDATNENRLLATGNIYFIFSNAVLKYIGQRKSKGIKTRLKQHFEGSSFSVDERGVQNGTVSKWNLVKEELALGNSITFKTIFVKPETLRTTIELELIEVYKPKWNIQY